MIDLHTHSILSDGELIPLELARRAQQKGYEILGISDHVDVTNIEFVVSSILKLRDQTGHHEGIRIIPGVEITHSPVRLLSTVVRQARRLGIGYVVVHGETIVEPVEPGTNRAAIEAGVDILAHPGLISEEDVEQAKEKGVLLEISARRGHSLTNGHVARLARKIGAKLIFDTDAHSPSDLVDDAQALRVVVGAGLSNKDYEQMKYNAITLVNTIRKRRAK